MSNNKINPDERIWCKLDRAMGKAIWFDEFKDVTATFLPRGISDHSPVIVLWGAKNLQKGFFKYYRFWEDFNNYDEMFKECWEGSATARNLYMLQVKMKRMKSMFKGSFAKFAKDMDKRVDKAREDLLIAQAAIIDLKYVGINKANA
ncbi:hypothetical protein QQ045_004535 [Rhodiola kirilowii]